MAVGIKVVTNLFMEILTVLRANLKHHFGGLFGIFLLIFIASSALSSAITIWINSGKYIDSELDRAGYGSLTAWVSGDIETEKLSSEIAALNGIKNVDFQKIIFTNYTVNTQESDSEGQLIKYSENENRYKFFNADMSGYLEKTPKINLGEVYVSPSFISVFGIEIGNEISFAIARNGGMVNLTVAGFYENPFMGSSMIGMKGFLVCPEDFEKIAENVRNSGINALARNGAMLHIFTEKDKNISEINNLINEKTSLSDYTEFVHSKEAISGFMLVLHNAFCGIAAAFVHVLLMASAAVIGHNIGSTIESDFSDMGILKTIGFTNKKLRFIQFLQYLFAIVPAVILGIILSAFASSLICRATLTSVGISVPSKIPAFVCTAAFAAIIIILSLFIFFKTKSIEKIPPIQVIQNNFSEENNAGKSIPISGNNFYISIAARQFLAGKRKYFGACAVAVLLTFFASLTGRINSWLGADGKGMMDAFNPADHDIGVQSFGELTNAEFEKIICSHTEITDSYLLAMPNVSLNSVDFTANVITEPERFHILKGRACNAENEIVITEFIASDMGLEIGDTVTVGANLGSGNYVISGIYSCANDMGKNIGMSREGYLKIARDNPNLWCYHYFLKDPDCKYDITAELENLYGGDVHVHENTWPGLFGIISAMRGLTAFMYAAVIVFILIVTVMTSGKIMSSEQRDLGILKSIGFTNLQLEINFAMRFMLTAFIGAIIGIIFAAAVTDPVVSAIMKLAGISNFASSPNAFEIIFPAFSVIFLFGIFGLIAAGKVKKLDLTILISE